MGKDVQETPPSADTEKEILPGIKKVFPISNYVLIKKTQFIPQERVSEGGIIIPETVEKKNAHQIGVVLAVGPGKLVSEERTTPPNIYDTPPKALNTRTGELIPYTIGDRIPPDFKVGDRVVYNPYAGRVANPRLSLYELLLPADEVLGVLEEEEV